MPLLAEGLLAFDSCWQAGHALVHLPAFTRTQALLLGFRGLCRKRRGYEGQRETCPVAQEQEKEIEDIIVTCGIHV